MSRLGVRCGFRGFRIGSKLEWILESEPERVWQDALGFRIKRGFNSATFGHTPLAGNLFWPIDNCQGVF